MWPSDPLPEIGGGWGRKLRSAGDGSLNSFSKAIKFSVYAHGGTPRRRLQHPCLIFLLPSDVFTAERPPKPWAHSPTCPGCGSLSKNGSLGVTIIVTKQPKYATERRSQQPASALPSQTAALMKKTSRGRLSLRSCARRVSWHTDCCAYGW